MKRMSEVFELPVSAGKDWFDTDTIYNSDGNGDWAATFETSEHAQHAAQAINHVDALADALQFLLDEYIALANSGDAGNWSAEETPEGMKAIAALAAYRGGK